MTYTAEQANALLAGSDINTESDLRALISQLDVTATGEVTLTHGGTLADNVHTTAC